MIWCNIRSIIRITRAVNPKVVYFTTFLFCHLSCFSVENIEWRRSSAFGYCSSTENLRNTPLRGTACKIKCLETVLSSQTTSSYQDFSRVYEWFSIWINTHTLTAGRLVWTLLSHEPYNVSGATDVFTIKCPVLGCRQ